MLNSTTSVGALLCTEPSCSEGVIPPVWQEMLTQIKADEVFM